MRQTASSNVEPKAAESSESSVSRFFGAARDSFGQRAGATAAAARRLSGRLVSLGRGRGGADSASTAPELVPAPPTGPAMEQLRLLHERQCRRCEPGEEEYEGLLVRLHRAAARLLPPDELDASAAGEPAAPTTAPASVPLRPARPAAANDDDDDEDDDERRQRRRPTDRSTD